MTEQELLKEYYEIINAIWKVLKDFVKSKKDDTAWEELKNKSLPLSQKEDEFSMFRYAMILEVNREITRRWNKK